MPDGNNIHYLVCKMLRWDNIVVTVHGVDQHLPIPEGEKVVGFIPVYANMIDAQTEAGGHDIIALMIKNQGFVKHEGDGDGNDESG